MPLSAGFQMPRGKGKRLTQAEPSIADLRALQRRLNLLDVHVCWLGEKQFVVAHTDEERATIDLEDCDLHGWLHDQDGPPEKIGYYIVTPHEPDTYSEPYPVARFDFTPLGASSDLVADLAHVKNVVKLESHDGG